MWLIASHCCGTSTHLQSDIGRYFRLPTLTRHFGWPASQGITQWGRVVAGAGSSSRLHPQMRIPPMTIFPVRDVAKYGVITDQDAYDIPTEAWSLACNVRFQNRKVARGPVWRAVQQPLSEGNPRFVVGNTFNTGQDALFIGYESGDVKQLLNGVETRPARTRSVRPRPLRAFCTSIGPTALHGFSARAIVSSKISPSRPTRRPRRPPTCSISPLCPLGSPLSAAREQNFHNFPHLRRCWMIGRPTSIH